MLASLDDLDYVVEWRVIDASSYDFSEEKSLHSSLFERNRAPPKANRFKSDGIPVEPAYLPRLSNRALEYCLFRV